MSAFGGDDAADDDSFGLPEIRLRPLDDSSSAGERPGVQEKSAAESLASGESAPPASEIPSPQSETAPVGESSPMVDTTIESSPDVASSSVSLGETPSMDASAEMPPPAHATSDLKEEESQLTTSAIDDFPEDHDPAATPVNTETWGTEADAQEPSDPGERSYIPVDVTVPPGSTEPPVLPGQPDHSPRRNRLLYLLIPASLVLLASLLFIFYKPSAPVQEEHLKLLEEHAKPKRSKPFSEKLPETLDKGNRKPNSGVTGATTMNVSVPTGRFYVIVHSSIDRDLVLDSCRKYNREGLNCKVILSGPHAPFNRLSLADFDNFPSAQTRAVQLRPRFGPSVWVLQY